MTYQELLETPEWRHRRARILSRDGGICQWCGQDKGVMHVHHMYYEFGNAPWEYEDTALITLCAQCHSEHHEIERRHKAPENNISRPVKTLYELMIEFATELQRRAKENG